MNLTELNSKLAGKSVSDTLKLLAETFRSEAVFTTSFGLEDQVITHIIFDNAIPVEIATLDTGRLFPETYKVYNETLKRYGKKIKVYFPDRNDIEKMVAEKGPFSFYYSKENRQECCNYRKIIPLDRALIDKKLWISGIRADQSGTRNSMKWLEYDKERMIIKFYPLFNWSFDEVKAFVKENSVPYNVLHDRGFVSIGCEPCTRAIRDGEDFRAGRWWWEHGSEKECGLHSR